MSEKTLVIHTLGEFSISLNGQRVDDSSSRSRKMWSLLAYLIRSRGRTVSQEELMEQLWNEEKNDNPRGSLKTTIWRVRSTLAPVAEAAGQELVVRVDGGYRWTDTPQSWVDIEAFEALCREGMSLENQALGLEKLEQAMGLYQGEFLGKLSGEVWVMPQAAYYHNLYHSVALEVLPRLLERGEAQRVSEMARDVLRTEPCDEEMYQILIRALLALGDKRGATAAYEEMREVLFTTLGVSPSEASQNLYRKELSGVTDRIITLDMIQEELREQSPAAGALVCEYDFFKYIYRLEARAVARRGDAVHIGVLTLSGKEGRELPKQVAERAMNHLQDELRLNLRRGDVIARCGMYQFIVLLVQANYENSRMVCDRVVRAFFRRYPHSPVEINYAVQPIQPLED